MKWMLEYRNSSSKETYTTNDSTDTINDTVNDTGNDTRGSVTKQ